MATPPSPYKGRDSQKGKVSLKENRTFVLWLLTLVYLFNFIDRQVIGILSPFIKEDLGLSDGQLGWLKGFAFALLYTLVGIPIAWLADRYSRVKIISVSLGVWSFFTALTGMAGSFAAILLARFGVGIGEAGGSPPSHSIISDLYPKEKRASALGIYSLGIPFGVAFSFIAVGLLMGWLGWRGTLYLLGALGVGLSFIVGLMIKEPVRGAMEGKPQHIEPASLGHSIATLMKIPSWWAMCMGIAWVSFGSYAIANWGIDYALRLDPSYHISTGNGKFQRLMFALGIAHLIGYGGGTYLGALLTEKLARRHTGFYGFVPAVALILGVPAAIGCFWVGSVPSFVILLAIYLTCSGVYLGPSFSVAQTLAPVNMRAMSTALFFLIFNIIALGGGPTYVGLMSEYLGQAYGELHGLRLAMSSLIIPFIISIFAFFIAGRWLPKDWERAEARQAEL